MISTKMTSVATCLIAVGVWAQPVDEAAGPPGPRIEITITDELVLPTGVSRTVLRDAAGNLVTRPGDVIRYRLTASNRGSEPARNTELLDPIPAGTEYVIGSARGDGMRLLFSIDGGRTFEPQPVRYEVRSEQGEVIEVAAEPGMYTHVKWSGLAPIPPGGEVEASFQVRVSQRQDTEQAK